MAATLALAGGIHIGVALEHGLATPHGASFVVLGALQVATTALIVRRPSPRLLAITLALSAVAASAWAASRLPAFGPQETIGVLDMAATGLELLTIGGSLSLLLGPVQPRPTRTFRTPVLLVAVAVAATSTAVLPSSHADHHHGPEAEASARNEGHRPARSADGDGGRTVDEPIFGDLFADHHAAAETPRDEQPDSDDGHQTAEAVGDADEDGHAAGERHELGPSDGHGAEDG